MELSQKKTAIRQQDAGITRVWEPDWGIRLMNADVGSYDDRLRDGFFAGGSG